MQCCNWDYSLIFCRKLVSGDGLWVGPANEGFGSKMSEKTLVEGFTSRKDKKEGDMTTTRQKSSIRVWIGRVTVPSIVYIPWPEMACNLQVVSGHCLLLMAPPPSRGPLKTFSSTAVFQGWSYLDRFSWFSRFLSLMCDSPQKPWTSAPEPCASKLCDKLFVSKALVMCSHNFINTSSNH